MTVTVTVTVTVTDRDCDPKEQIGKDLEGAVDSYKSLSIARLLKCSKHFDGKELEE